MQKVRNRLIHIHRCRGVTRKMIRHMFQYDASLKAIYSLSHKQFMNLFSISSDRVSTILHDLHDYSLIRRIKQDLNHFTVITMVDDKYPHVLKPIKDSPFVLYAAGNVELLSMGPSLSVIGTRNPSQEAIPKLRHLLPPLVDEDWIIVSGMAKGIDSYAHQLALSMNGKTIAILGGGFHHIYPRQNITLYHKIRKHGLVLSEYPPSIKPERYHFPERNRIISGLSYGTLVLEATERSGTLITVDQALEQGREVYAVPGSPTIPQTKGCHRMIQDGAMLVSDADDILENWEMVKASWNYKEKSWQQSTIHI